MALFSANPFLLAQQPKQPSPLPSRDAWPHPGHNLGLGRQSWSTARARLGRIAGPSIWRRWSRSDGCAASSGEQNLPPAAVRQP